MKIVVDNKIWMSYLLSGEKKVFSLFQQMGKGNVELLLSEQLIDDLAFMYKLPGIRTKVAADVVESFIMGLIQYSTIIDTKVFVEGKTNDEDIIYANVAVAGKAQFLITVDSEMHRFEKLDGYKLMNVIDLFTFVENAGFPK